MTTLPSRFAGGFHPYRRPGVAEATAKEHPIARGFPLDSGSHTMSPMGHSRHFERGVGMTGSRQ